MHERLAHVMIVTVIDVVVVRRLAAPTAVALTRRSAVCTDSLCFHHAAAQSSTVAQRSQKDPALNWHDGTSEECQRFD